MCVEKKPRHKAGILKYTVMKTHKTQVMEVNYLTENTLLLH